jgi:DNA-binding MarR family transcriptional regulator
LSRTKTTIVAVFVLAATFLAGAAVGILGDRMFHRRRGIPEFATHVMVNRLSRHLDLDDAQRKKVAAIIERHHARINAFFTDMRPRVREEIEQANREIEVLLTPEQRKKFERMKMHVMRHADRGRTESTK